MEQFRALEREQRLTVLRDVRRGQAVTDSNLAPAAIEVARAMQRTFTVPGLWRLPNRARSLIVMAILGLTVAVIFATALAGRYAEAGSVALLLFLAIVTTRFGHRRANNAARSEAANEELLRKANNSQ